MAMLITIINWAREHNVTWCMTRRMHVHRAAMQNILEVRIQTKSKRLMDGTQNILMWETNMNASISMMVDFSKTNDRHRRMLQHTNEHTCTSSYDDPISSDNWTTYASLALTTANKQANFHISKKRGEMVQSDLHTLSGIHTGAKRKGAARHRHIHWNTTLQLRTRPERENLMALSPDRKNTKVAVCGFLD